MAFSASKFNKGSKFTFKTPDNFQYNTLDVLYSQYGNEVVFPVKALYLNDKGKFGTHPVVVTDKELVDLPKHMTETVREIMADDEAVDAINNGKVGFTVYQYIDSKYKRTCYSITWVDVQ